MFDTTAHSILLAFFLLLAFLIPKSFLSLPHRKNFFKFLNKKFISATPYHSSQVSLSLTFPEMTMFLMLLIKGLLPHMEASTEASTIALVFEKRKHYCEVYLIPDMHSS